MKYYKTLLLCSASLLLLAAGVAYAEEETPQGMKKRKCLHLQSQQKLKVLMLLLFGKQ